MVQDDQVVGLPINSRRRLIAQEPHVADEPVQDVPTLARLIGDAARFLWKDWPVDMEITLLNFESGVFTLTGVCPHCAPTKSVFMPVGTPCMESRGVWQGEDVHRVVAIMRCQGCLEYILGIALFND